MDYLAESNSINSCLEKARDDKGREDSKKVEYCLLNALRKDQRRGTYYSEFHQDLFQYLHITDSSPVKTKIGLVENISFKKKTSSGIPMLVEIIPEGKSAEIEISFDFMRYQRSIKNPSKITPFGNKKVTIEDILEVVHERTMAHLSSEEFRIKRSELPNRDDLLSFYRMIRDISENRGEDEFILRVGRFSGTDFVTIGRIRKAKYGRTINITEIGRVLGWIKVELKDY